MSWFKNLVSKKKNIAVFVDGPNMLRKELNVDLKQIKDIATQFGTIKIGKVFLNQFAPTKLSEAVVNQGFEVAISVGDVDVMMAVEAATIAYNKNIDVICFVTRDSDFIPAIQKAKALGKETVAILVDESSAAALKNCADYIVILNRQQKGRI
ncbi:MAG: TIGR00288 family protein [Candidatus Diapherotrites archaeon CG08_land_8_20_14_0_20_30_16]|nr:MAG: TIGR00288 family protein [Candidatus Diapherotrites archaeon CG08_land_8_20_14_0_20_30_16]